MVVVPSIDGTLSSLGSTMLFTYTGIKFKSYQHKSSKGYNNNNDCNEDEENKTHDNLISSKSTNKSSQMTISQFDV